MLKLENSIRGLSFSRVAFDLTIQGRLKNEMFYGFENTFESLDNLKRTMIDYIHYHNNFRITVKGKGLTPLQIRNQALALS